MRTEPRTCSRRAARWPRSEKAQQKLAPGTWQHTMLRDNLKALGIASALMESDERLDDAITRDDLEEALGALRW